MKIALVLAAFLVLVVLALQAAVRLAPADPDRWHAAPEVEGAGEATVVSRSGIRAARLYDAPPAEMLARLDRIARDTARTNAIAGSVDDGMITYETRSAFWGFPDYTTVVAAPAAGGGTRIEIHGRLRFGRSGLGVNRARVEGWLAQLD